LETIGYRSEDITNNKITIICQICWVLQVWRGEMDGRSNCPESCPKLCGLP
jgi:hypothetical protein